MNKIKIVIIGGGFGGVYTARNLYKFFGKGAEITLINKSNYFIFTPLLHEVATGTLTPHSIAESLAEIFHGTQVNCIEDTATEVDRDNKIVKTVHGKFKYDYLVIASGAETNYFSIPGAKENSLTLKNLNDAIYLRNEILSIFKKTYEMKDPSMLSFAIVGAGATGIEVATELIEYLKYILKSYYEKSYFSENDLKVSVITNTEDILTQFPAPMRKIALKELKRKKIEVINSTSVSKVDPHCVITSEGKLIKANMIIWLAGVKPSLSEIRGIEIGPKGRMETNDYLQSLNHSEIFGLGDAASVHPMLAQIAVEQAKVVANNIYSLNKGLGLVRYSTKIKGLLISLGKWSAIGQFGKITLSGPIMWWIWRTVYLFNFNSWKKRLEIAFEWTVSLFYPRDITYLK